MAETTTTLATTSTTTSRFDYIAQAIDDESINNDVDSVRLALLYLQTQINELKDDVNHSKLNNDDFFLVVNAVFILMMQAGFSFFECGSVRSKNVVNMLLKNTLDAFIGGFCYWACGFAFAFGEPSNPVYGKNYFFFHNMDDNLFSTWFFHYSFCVTAATIVSGAVAERCDFRAYLIYTVVISSITYPFVSHWAWYGSDDPAQAGWLNNLGYQDFAGSGVVHMTGGTCALVAALVLGPRTGRFVSKHGLHPEDFIPHNIPLVTLGAFFLFVGFFAFNGGSQASISVPLDGMATGRAMVNTILAGSPAAFIGTFLYRLFDSNHKFSLVGTLGAGLGGMVAICAGCNKVEGWAAAIIGSCSAFVFFFSSKLLRYLHIDDPVDAIPVHLCCGFWGLVATPLFDFEYGVLTTGSMLGAQTFGINVAGGLAIALWCVANTLPLFMVMKSLGSLRVPPEMEVGGLDEAKHGEVAYADCMKHNSSTASSEWKTESTVVKEMEGNTAKVTPPLPRKRAKQNGTDKDRNGWVL